ncbi:imidazole glycerol phosphate synthase subunit HisH [Halomonas sp. DQ26W]|nr:imidazole glycerol phosphate synthase subunit HisH [Halomonas sp. DQ26W]
MQIIDYGAGNIASVANMIEYVGGEADIVISPDQLKCDVKIILPGVGAFDHGMTCLEEGGWIPALVECVQTKRTPILGICLGMQLMCNSSEEGQRPGLGWIDASARRFTFSADSGLKVPHMGWNRVVVSTCDELVSDETDTEKRFYFVHSYYISCAREEDVILTCHHGHDFVAGFHRENIWGLQFHPEKSHRFGMEVFRRFLEV